MYRVFTFFCLLFAWSNLQAVEQESTAVDPVIQWNRILRNTISKEQTPPPIAARNFAILHGAIFDAVNAVAREYEPLQITAISEPGSLVEVVAHSAGNQVLSRLYPNREDSFDREFKASIQPYRDEFGFDDSVKLGRNIAEKYLTWRDGDFRDIVVSFEERSAPGYWESADNEYTPALLPGWGKTQTFALVSPSQFRSEPPNHMRSDAYAADYEEVRTLGRKEGSRRTEEQTEIAEFWEAGPGTITIPGQWNAITERLAIENKRGTVENAKTFAILNFALADAGIAAWDSKYLYGFWRPVTAIHRANTDNNRRTRVEANWVPLQKSSSSPEHISSHSAFSGAAEVVLISEFGFDSDFTCCSDTETLTIRSFKNIREAAEEAGRSRIYAGTHFESSNQKGLASGRSIGKYVVENLSKPIAERDKTKRQND